MRAFQESPRLALGWGHANKVAKNRRGSGRINMPEHHASTALVRLLYLRQACLVWCGVEDHLHPVWSQCVLSVPALSSLSVHMGNVNNGIHPVPVCN